jgi:hypothetical protein
VVVTGTVTLDGALVHGAVVDIHNLALGTLCETDALDGLNASDTTGPDGRFKAVSYYPTDDTVCGAIRVVPPTASAAAEVVIRGLVLDYAYPDRRPPDTLIIDVSLTAQ